VSIFNEYIIPSLTVTVEKLAVLIDVSDIDLFTAELFIDVLVSLT
jgi:hypothetical protein